MDHFGLTELEELPGVKELKDSGLLDRAPSLKELEDEDTADDLEGDDLDELDAEAVAAGLVDRDPSDANDRPDLDVDKEATSNVVPLNN